MLDQHEVYYIAMKSRDASNGAGLIRPTDLRKRAGAWRPWRSYAAMYLWSSLADKQVKS